ncbi:hypothetical protein HBH64_041180 [Parastagonospora nodorum]|nr:hypothetical protein HBH52_096970 [Parastagonospora nodorum]KAH3999506.1 hypothetical protein HBI10_116410 [Parastagonospora nodorum]KAH4013313.1 hypothetical protein HBI13_182470 [Parastagonospora nodorum]KAH4185397.1 hypothetical protein HBH42_180390 [Parastagonospora nodorum]KAH4295156.1 hypothetical protein HBI02_175590 [Parastagonospora nodorum]
MAPRNKRDRKRQTTISFSPAAKPPPSATMGASPSKSPASTPNRHSSTRASRNTKASSSRASKPTVIYSSSEDELAAETHRGMSLGIPTNRTEHDMFGSSDVDCAASQTSEDERGGNNIQVKAKLASRKRRREAEDDVGVTVIKTKRRRRNSPEDDELRLPRSKRRTNVEHQSSTGEEGDDNKAATVQVTPVRRTRRIARRQSASEQEASPPRSKRRRIARRRATPSDESEKSQESEDSDGEIVDGAESDGEDEEDEEDEDLKEDLAFLRSSPLPDRGKLRSTHEKPKSERQKALEALKKRRAGTNEPSSSATPARTRRVVIESDLDTDSDLEIIKEEPESEEELNGNEDEEEEELGSDRDANALDMFLEDEEDEAFIDNDPDAMIGEPILAPNDFMPLILSRLSSSKPRELFKYAIEWMVMKKIHPGFESKSEVYDITFRKLDDEVKGLANSKFSSSAWTPDFTRVLRARPDLMIMEISRSRKDIMDAHCEACNRRNHPASDELMFTGKPYNKDTLEPLDNDSDSDSNDENDSDDDDDSELSADSEVELNGEKPTYDAQGARLPPESKAFTVGSTCKSNAQVAHTLHHWRYHLYSWVKDYLVREGYLAAEKLVKRDGWSDKKREKAALKIVKHMEAAGEVMKLYKLYKDQMTYAAEYRHDQNRSYRGRG